MCFNNISVLSAGTSWNIYLKSFVWKKLTSHMTEFKAVDQKVLYRKCLHYSLCKVADKTQLAFYINLQRAVIGPSATLTGR